MGYLPEITVRGVNKKQPKRYDNQHYVMEPDRWISSEAIKEDPPTTFEDLLFRLLGGVEITENGIRKGGGPVSFLLNGRELSYSDLVDIVHVSEIAQADWYAFDRTVALIIWPPGVAPANGIKFENKKLILPLGYQNPVAFYSPKYDTPEALNNPSSDLRSTIYWKPDIITNNNNAAVEFYTADSPTTYSVIIEGVSNDGKLVYYRKNSIIQVVK